MGTLHSMRTSGRLLGDAPKGWEPALTAQEEMALEMEKTRRSKSRSSSRATTARSRQSSSRSSRPPSSCDMDVANSVEGGDTERSGCDTKRTSQTKPEIGPYIPFFKHNMPTALSKELKSKSAKLKDAPYG